MLDGFVVKQVRPMTPFEMRNEGWEAPLFGTPPMVIEFTNGTRVFASADAEGNGPGVLFGIDEFGAFQVATEPMMSDA